jgi:hypothetical protein
MWKFAEFLEIFLSPMWKFAEFVEWCWPIGLD